MLVETSDHLACSQSCHKTNAGGSYAKCSTQSRDNCKLLERFNYYHYYYYYHYWFSFLLAYFSGCTVLQVRLGPQVRTYEDCSLFAGHTPFLSNQQCQNIKGRQATIYGYIPFLLIFAVITCT